jgi:hypothetical protein
MITRMRKEAVLEKVRKNYATHKHVVEKAIEGYRKAATAELERHLARLKKGRPQRVYVSISEPMNMSREYERVIAMVEQNEDDVIQLSEDEFRHYIMDDWSWTNEWNTSMLSYLPRRESAKLGGDDDVDQSSG